MYYTLGLKTLPFEQVKKQAIYVENEYNEDVNRYIQENYDKIHTHFSNRGWDFVYFPRLVEELKDSRIVEYNVPYAEGINDSLSIRSDFLLQFMAYPENRGNIKPSLLYVNPIKYPDDYTEFQYRAIRLTDDIVYDATDNFSNVLDRIIEDTVPKIRFQKKPDDDGILFREGDDDEVLYRSGDEDEEEDYLISDPDIRKLMMEAKEIVNKLKEVGVKEYVLEKLIYGEEKLSRLHITKDYRILLPDYNIEIELKPLPKILYFLFLNHPEGIFFKDLPDYRDELMKYYMDIKDGFISKRDARERIERLTTPWDNSVNEKCSNIKAAFISKVNDRIARNYYIVGGRMETRYIALSRNLLIWDK